MALFREQLVRKVKKSAIDEIEKIAAMRYPKEACGFLVKIGKAVSVVECANTHENPREYFRIDAKDFSQASDSGEIVAVWHTHPKNTPPSDFDRVSCEESELPWLIFPFKCDEGRFVYGEMQIIEPCGHVAPYIGRPYIYETFNCFTLVRDYYRYEFGITLGDHKFPHGWWKTGGNHYVDLFEQEGFFQVLDGKFQIGDVLLMQTEPGNPGHIAVYVGGDMILHHCEKRLSRRDVYGGGYWQKHTTHHLRHKELATC